ncbi:MAG: helix-turn-helix domain-containing protein [Chloroflexota bacterium]|nr:helix-turn-helix domain-containing protein [Chloroflexota bacterium]
MSTKQPEQKRTVSVEEAAKVLGIGRGLAYQEARLTGQLIGVPVLRVGRRLLISRAALDRALAGNPQPDQAAS